MAADRTTSGHSSEPDGDEGGGLWLDDDRTAAPPARSTGRRVAALVGLVAVIAVVAVPVGLALASGHNSGPTHHTAQSTSTSTPVTLGNGPAVHQVLSALSATTDTGNFDVSYTLAAHAGLHSAPPTTCYSPDQMQVQSGSYGGTGVLPVAPVGGTASKSTGPAQGRSASATTCVSMGSPDASVAGHGTIDVNPKAMVVSASVNTSLDVSVRLDDQQVWESGGDDYGMTPDGTATATSGQPLSQFAGLVESTLGDRAGAVAMNGMASPAGYLDLDEQSVTGAAASGTGTVDGVAVTFYEVAQDPARVAQAPGLSADEVSTINAAVAVMRSQGYTGTTVRLAVDGAGLIRQATSTANFSDGGTVVLDAHFSKFGCAGIVTMPGQPAPPATTLACAADTPTTTVTTPTTAPASTFTVPTTATTVPGPTTSEATTTSELDGKLTTTTTEANTTAGGGQATP